MKVYELMNELALMPSGAKVIVHAVKHETEMPICDTDEDGNSYTIKFEVQEIRHEDDDTEVELDIWWIKNKF